MVQQQLKLVTTLSSQLQVHLASLPKKVVSTLCLEIFYTLCPRPAGTDGRGPGSTLALAASLLLFALSWAAGLRRHDQDSHRCNIFPKIMPGTSQGKPVQAAGNSHAILRHAIADTCTPYVAKLRETLPKSNLIRHLPLEKSL